MWRAWQDLALRPSGEVGHPLCLRPPIFLADFSSLRSAQSSIQILTKFWRPPRHATTKQWRGEQDYCSPN